MRNRFLSMVLVIACGVIFASCGGGSGSGSNSGGGVKKNTHLGLLPSIYADYNAKVKAQEAKVEEEGKKLMAGGEKNTAKLMKLMTDDETTTKAMKEKLKVAVGEEIAKLTDKEIPVTFSKALLDSDELFYNVAPATLVAEKDRLSIAFSFSAKNVFEVPRLKGHDFGTYFRLVAADGSTIIKTVLLPVKLENKAFTITAGDQLLEYKLPLSISNMAEAYSNFAGVEFITKAEYNK